MKLTVGISDLNWARLTSWRGLLADFYDVPEYRAALEEIDKVCITYVAPQTDETAIAPQALLMAGWLASRLQWAIKDKPGTQEGERTLFEFGTSAAEQLRLNFFTLKKRGYIPDDWRALNCNRRPMAQPSKWNAAPTCSAC